MRNAGLEEAQAGIKIAGRNINNLQYADDTTLMAESVKELKSFLMNVKEERGKAGLKLSIQKTKFMASSPITSWQTDGERKEIVIGGQRFGVSASTSVLLMKTQDWFPLGWTGWISLQSKGLSRVFSNTTVQQHQYLGTQLSL